MALPADIERMIAAQYADSARVEALHLISGLECRECERVRRCALQGAHGDIVRLRSLIELARRDYRDVIMMGEYEREGDALVKRRNFSAPWSEATHDVDQNP